MKQQRSRLFSPRATKDIVRLFFSTNHDKSANIEEKKMVECPFKKRKEILLMYYYWDYYFSLLNNHLFAVLYEKLFRKKKEKGTFAAREWKKKLCWQLGFYIISMIKMENMEIWRYIVVLLGQRQTRKEKHWGRHMEAGLLVAAESHRKRQQQRVEYHVINGAISGYSTARSLRHLLRWQTTKSIWRI